MVQNIAIKGIDGLVKTEKEIDAQLKNGRKESGENQ